MAHEPEHESSGGPPDTPSPDSLCRLISTALAGLASFYLATASVDATTVAAALAGFVIVWYTWSRRP